MASFVFLDSRDSLQTGRNNEFSWYLSGVNNNITQNVSFSIDQFTMPFSRYVIHSYNKYLYVAQNGGAVQLVTLVEGNYTAVTLGTELKTRLDALGVNVFTISYNSTTQKYTFSVPIPNTFQLFTGSYNCYDVIGLDLNYHTTAVSSLTMPSQVNLAGTQFIDIICTSIPVSNTKSGLSYPLLWRIPCNVPIGNLLYWENYNPDRAVKVSPYQLDNISITLIDDAGNPYDLDLLHPLTITFKMSTIT